MMTKYKISSVPATVKGKLLCLYKTLFLWITLLHTFGAEAATHMENRYGKPETWATYAATTANNTTTDRIPLGNGTYQITFLLSYFSKSVFSDKPTILAEKQVLVDDLRNERPDKPCKSFSLTYTIQVADGMLDIDYMNQAANVKLGMIIKKTGNSIAAPKAPVPKPPVTNGLRYRYYEGTWSQIPSFGKLVAKKEGIVSNFTLSPRVRQDYFGFEFMGYIQINQSGTYTFYTAADDGSMVYIKGSRVVNNDRAYGMQEKSGKIYLEKGRHYIRVKYFERMGGEKLTVQYAGPGISKKPVPDAVLFPDEEAASQLDQENIPASEENTYQVNFNAEATDSHKSWNNFSSKPTTGSKITSLKNSKGQTSAVSVTLTSNWTGHDNRGYNSKKEAGIYPDAVTRSYFWSRNEESVEIGGLDARKQYDFTFYASSAYNQNRMTDYTINGKKVSMDASLNQSKTVTLSKVQPDKSGKVTLWFAPGTGSAYAIINAMVIKTTVTSTARIGTSASEHMALDEPAQVEVTSAADTLEEAAAPSLSVYPNPVSQVLYVNVSEPTQYMLYNARGEEVTRGDHTGIGSLEIITSHLKRGLYHLHLTSGQQHWIKTVMVRH